MQPDVVAQRVDALAERLRRSVVVNDPLVRMRYASRHFGDEDDVRVRAVLQHGADPDAVRHVLAQGVVDWTTPGRIPGEPAIGMDARLCAPVRWHGELLGLVMVIDADGMLDAESVAAVRALADDLAAPLLTERDAAQQDRDDEALVAALVSRDDVVRTVAVAAFERHRPALAQRRVWVLAVRDPGAAETTAPIAPIALRHARSATGDDLDVLVAAGSPGSPGGPGSPGSPGAVLAFPAFGSDPTAITRLATALVDAAADVGRPGCVVGIGEAVDGAAGVRRSWRQAELAGRAVPRLHPGPVVDWAELGTAAVLVRVPDDEWDDTAVPPELAALDDVDAHGRLRETLHAFLTAGGSGPRAAEALQVHRTTLYYRLDRIRELTGLDLDDGETRLRLHLGLQVERLLRRPPSFDV